METNSHWRCGNTARKYEFINVNPLPECYDHVTQNAFSLNYNLAAIRKAQDSAHPIDLVEHSVREASKPALEVTFEP